MAAHHRGAGPLPDQFRDNNQDSRACPPIIYGLCLRAPAHVIDSLASMLARYRRRAGSRWRGYDTRLQAILTVAWLQGGHTYRSLAAGNGVSKDTCRHYVHEGITVLARRAVSLTEVVRLAVAAGWPYLIVNGVNVPTQRLADRKWFSGKHKRFGGNVQVVAAPVVAAPVVAAPDGELLWASPALPGATPRQ